MMLFMKCSAVVVECPCLKPCWCDASVMLSVMYGSIIFSIVLAMGERSAMGRYDVPISIGFPGLGIGMIFACFQVLGIVFVLMEMLNMCVRYLMAVGPRCFRCLMFMLSGPVELLFFACLIACIVWPVVIVIGVFLSFLVFLSIILFRD